jgi:hypothetical protein
MYGADKIGFPVLFFIFLGFQQHVGVLYLSLFLFPTVRPQ